MRLGALSEPCPQGFALHPDTAVCIPVDSPVFVEQTCRTPEGIEIPCPDVTSVTVTESVGVPGWVWALSAGMIWFSLLKRGSR